MKRKITYIIAVISISIIFMSCEDSAPTDFLPKTFVEAYIYVDEPIRNIIIMNTQPLSDSFDYDKSMVNNATVEISEENGQTLLLEYQNGDPKGYYYPDTTYLVKPETRYSLRIEMADGSLITGETTTPARFSWVREVKDTIYYPKDTLNLPETDSLRFSWERAGDTVLYLLRVMCLDTLEYGKYLGTDTSEKNRRIERPFGNRSRYYNDVSRWVGPLPTTEAPVVWNALKWYGLSELSVYAPDYNFLRWFIHVQRRGYYEELLGSVDGAMGVFGSASVVRKKTFIIKNQK